MKICPNCGAENTDNALSCVLCEFEFDNDTAEYSENYAEPISEKKAESEPALASNKYTEPPVEARPISNSNTASSVPEKASAAGKGKIIAIAAAALILVVGGIGIGVLMRKNKGSTPNNGSNSGNSVVTSMTETKGENTTATSTIAETITKAQATITATETEATTVNTTSVIETTTKAAAPQATASITVAPQSINGNGTCLLLTVTGNYSYYYYEIYADFEGQKNVLRKSGTSYDSSYQYEDGSTVSNFVFYVTPYNAEGVAGNQTTLNYNGPLQLHPSNSSAISSCTKYGTIYSPAGYKVKGYSKSYLIDGGAESYVRQDLTDGWHIKAVNCYISDTSGWEWYELYDADDGDYYGWVSNHNISFY